MAIEIWSSDAAGHLMLMPDPTPARPAQGTAPPEGEPPLPEAPAETPSPPPDTPAPPDDLAALRRLIEAREAKDQERAVHEARREAQVETLTRVLRGEESPPAPGPPAPPATRPSAEAYTNQDDYIDAVADWKTDQKLTAFREEQRQAQSQAQQMQAMQARELAVKQAEDAFVRDHADYVEVVTRGLVNTTPQGFRQFLMAHLDHADTPAVAYALAKDEALRGRLVQMPPAQLLYALGRLSGQGGGSAPPPAATPPAAASSAGGPPAGGLPPGAGTPPAGSPERPKPPPPRPLSGTGTAPVGGYSDDMTMEEYRRWRTNGGGR